MDYSIGDTIEYSPFGGGTRQVIVKTKEDDVKNGLPGFTGVLMKTSSSDTHYDYHAGVWGYDYQITRVAVRILDKEN